MTDRHAGFTLIEVLVAAAILLIALTLSSGILTALAGVPRTKETLSVTQANSQWFENATNVWIPPANFGNLGLLTAVPPISGHTWSAQACEVTLTTSPVAVTCGAAVTSGLPTFASGTQTTTALQVRLNLTYTSSTGASTTTSLVVAKR